MEPSSRAAELHDTNHNFMTSNFIISSFIALASPGLFGKQYQPRNTSAWCHRLQSSVAADDNKVLAGKKNKGIQLKVDHIDFKQAIYVI